MLAGRMRWLFVFRGLVVTGRDALRGHVKVQTVRHSFEYDAEGSAFHDNEFDGIDASTAEMFGTIERVV